MTHIKIYGNQLYLDLNCCAGDEKPFVINTIDWCWLQILVCWNTDRVWCYPER